MVNYPYESSFLAPLPAYPVEAFCAYLNESLESTQLIDVSGASENPKKWIFKWIVHLFQALQKAVSVYSNYNYKL